MYRHFPVSCTLVATEYLHFLQTYEVIRYCLITDTCQNVRYINSDLTLKGFFWFRTNKTGEFLGLLKRSNCLGRSNSCMFESELRVSVLNIT